MPYISEPSGDELSEHARKQQTALREQSVRAETEPPSKTLWVGLVGLVLALGAAVFVVRSLRS